MKTKMPCSFVDMHSLPVCLLHLCEYLFRYLYAHIRYTHQSSLQKQMNTFIYILWHLNVHLPHEAREKHLAVRHNNFMKVFQCHFGHFPCHPIQIKKIGNVTTPLILSVTIKALMCIKVSLDGLIVLLLISF